MKIIRKTAKFAYSDKQKFYHEKFDTYKEFYDVLMSRQSKAHRTIEYIFNDNDASWIGVKSVEEAKNLFLNGWQQNVEKLKIAFKKELDVLEHGRPVKLVNAVNGFIPIVPNAIMGLPNSMIDMRLSPKKSKILNFMIAIDRSCANSVEEIIKKMSKMFAYIAMLERSGQYRCRIEIFFTAYGGYDCESKTYTSASIVVKNENQLFDIKRLCFPVIHPAMLRLFMFAWNESLPLDYSSYRISGYGTSFEHWSQKSKQDFINMVNNGNEHTICLDFKSDIEEVVGKEVR